MLSSRQTRRAQFILILTGLVFAAYYFFVFYPLSQRASAVDAPLLHAWQRLGAARISSNDDHELDMAAIDTNLQQLRAAVATLKTAGESIHKAVALDKSIHEKMGEPFQLVDFQIEELLRIEELGRMAQVNKVAIAPEVFSNFPEYRADRAESELLWGQLAFLHQVLANAIQCNVSAIQSIQLPSHIAHAHSTNAPGFLYEIPIQVELTGSVESISKLLNSLPLRGGKSSSGLPEMPASKPSVFVDRIMLRKNSAESPDEAHLDLRVCGFIYRDTYEAK